jgi:hypothetical protein
MRVGHMLPRRLRVRDHEDVDYPEAPKLSWALRLRRDRPDPEHDVALIVDALERRNGDELQLFELHVDPDLIRMETAQRRFRGHYVRRLHRLSQRAGRDK